LKLTLTAVDYVLLSLYFIFVLGIGWLVKRRVSTSSEFLTSGRSVPVWITSLAFIAANLGAQEVIGMCASGAKYGILTSHFYWVGAIPAMLFVGIFMMPFYYGSKARSVPEYLKLRFDEKTRGLNAIMFAVMTIFSSGISMYALGQMFQLAFGWTSTASILVSAAIVLVYTLLGGLTSAIYNEVLQFFLIVLGFAPLAILATQKAGGWAGIVSRVDEKYTHMWSNLGNPAANEMGVEAFSLIVGLGFTLSFGYWCTNFLVVQRAMAANSMSAARRTPLIAAFPKMFMPFVVILPGIAALAIGHGRPVNPVTHQVDYNLVLTSMMGKFYPSGMLGIGLTALMASFMSGMAGNISAFNTVWTYDIYQSYIRKKAPDSHYLWMGRVATVAGVALSILTAYVAGLFNNIMDILQLVFGIVNAPLFATFVLGMFWKRATGHGAFAGLLTGCVGGTLMLGLTVAEGKGGWIGNLHEFHSSMAQNFWIAMLAFASCFMVTIVVSLMSRPKPVSELHNLVYGFTDIPKQESVPWYKRPTPLAIIVVVILIILNIIFW
jgi:SSS family solute:Na+ symporter